MNAVDLEAEKSKFVSYWSQSGHNAFPVELKTRYLDHLKRINENAKILKKWAKDYDTASDVLTEVLKTDPDLSVFAQIVALYERLSPKAFQFLRFPKPSVAVEAGLKGIRLHLDGKAGDGKVWKVREVVQLPTKTRVVVSKDSQRTLSAKLVEGQIDATIWEEILSSAKEAVPSAQTLTGIRVQLTAPNVFQFALEFDWATQQVQLESDMTDWLGETSKKAELSSTRLDAINFIAEEAGITAQAAVLTGLITKPEAVDPDLHTKLDKIIESDYLFIVVGGKFLVKGEQGKNDEEVNAELLSFANDNLVRDVQNHFRAKRSLESFLTSYGSYNRDNTKVQSSLRDSDAQGSCHGFFVQVFEKTSTSSDDQNSDDFEVEVLNFKYEQRTADWDVRTPKFSQRVRDAFISKLHEISRRPTRTPAPPAGGPTPATLS